MTIRTPVTIPFFLVFAMLFPQKALTNNVLVNGYITPTPEEVLKTVTKDPLPTPIAGGIKIFHSGYCDYTENDGNFHSPRGHSGDSLRLIITTNIGYDTYKNTVSSQQPVTSHPIAVYTLTKMVDEASKEQSNETKETTLGQENGTGSSHYLKVAFHGNEVPADGLKQSDLVIISDPKHFYLKDGGEYFIAESSHFVIPQGVIYLLSTPDAATINANDSFVQLIDAGQETENDPSQTTHTPQAPPGAEEELPAQRLIINADA